MRRSKRRPREPALTPLWPAGHLPLKGGDRQFQRWCQPCFAGDWRKQKRQPISPLEGEMAGRPEGGAWRPPYPEVFTAPEPCRESR
ncbi:hypothetical protein CIT25_10165 [Mesorhizobium mediterraneum]|uniref:Lytic murein transglycosylase n=1 Tax=Mesorhizobium mediterraneum TaxID=43617 RepID=A0AB36RCX8_9HYPH|nr:hypothetical protein CIT25_10165 [Mesorhizobium mediterraneum]